MISEALAFCYFPESKDEATGVRECLCTYFPRLRGWAARKNEQVEALFLYHYLGITRMAGSEVAYHE